MIILVFHSDIGVVVRFLLRRIAAIDVGHPLLLLELVVLTHEDVVVADVNVLLGLVVPQLVHLA